MAYIITQIDRTSGNYQDVFLYTLNASFNGIEGAITDARITFTIPDICTLYLGDLEYPVQEVRTETVEGGTQYTIDFGALSDTGVAVRIGFGITFALSAQNGAVYTFSPTLWLNGAVAERSVADAIVLALTPRFTLRKEVVLPTADPAAGGFVYYLVTLENEGDLGARVENIDIEALAAEGLTLDETFVVVGADASSDPFIDTSMDGVQGRIEGNVLSFTLASYRGARYTFLYRAQLARTLAVGQTIETTLAWEIDEIQQENAVHTLALGAPAEAVALSLYAPEYTLPSGKFACEWRLSNTGNQRLSAADCRLTLSQMVQYTTFRTGTFQMKALGELLDATYQINYTTATGQSGSFGSYNMGQNSNITLADFIPAGDNLLTLTWVFGDWRIGASQKATPRLLGVVAADAALGTAFESNVQCSWQIALGDAAGQPAQRTATQETQVEDISVLQPGFSCSVGENPVRPGDALRYTLTASAYRSRLNQPVFALLLPAALRYVGGESFRLNDVFGEATPTMPPVQQTPNVNAAGDTLLQFAFTGEYAYDFSPLSTLTLAFDAAVKVGATGSFGAFALLGTAAGAGQAASGVDLYSGAEIDALTATATSYAQSATITNRILFFVATSTQKRVRGLLDDAFAPVGGIGQTLSGGAVGYEITVRNIGNAALQTVEVVDILPHIGDTGVIDVKTARKSEFFVSLTGEVAAKIMQEDTGEILQDVPLAIWYSVSTDPLRFGGNFDTIGTVDDWLATAPENMLTVQSVKVAAAQPLLAGQSLVLSLSGLAPVGVPPQATAWNSFASQVSYDDIAGVRQTMLATEASKAGMQVGALPADKGEISGCAWFDANANGYFDRVSTDPKNPLEQALDDVGVVLYNASGTPLQVTFTSKTLDGRLGCYAFGNLDFGRYYLRFFIDDNTYQFTRQRLAQGGSIANATTGVSVAIDISESTRTQTANVGLLPKDKHKLSDILAVNRSARSVMRSVIYNQMLIGMKQSDLLDLMNE